MKSIIGKKISFISRVIRAPRLRPVVVHKTGEVVGRSGNTMTVVVEDKTRVYLPLHYYKTKITKSDIQSEIWTFVKDD